MAAGHHPYTVILSEGLTAKPAPDGFAAFRSLRMTVGGIFNLEFGLGHPASP
jgi:hypothetical protein